MNGIAACTITSESTNIFVIIMIYFEKPNGSSPRPAWKKLFGNLFDGCVLAGEFPYAKVGHWTNSGGKFSIIGRIPGFAMPYVPMGPIFLEDYVDPLAVAELYDVPGDFLDVLTNEKTLNGEGKLILTQEKLVWSMWSRTT